MTVIERQLLAVVNDSGMAGLTNCIIAYEPVWAIGTGKTATPEQVAETHRAIRLFLDSCDAGAGQNMRIIYGGSVKPDNAAELFQSPEVDGGLIGGASLHADEFARIGTALANTVAETDSACGAMD
jgi:triosephosphate isomerase